MISRIFLKLKAIIYLLIWLAKLDQQFWIVGECLGEGLFTLEY